MKNLEQILVIVAIFLLALNILVFDVNNLYNGNSQSVQACNKIIYKEIGVGLSRLSVIGDSLFVCKMLPSCGCGKR